MVRIRLAVLSNMCALGPALAQTCSKGTSREAHDNVEHVSLLQTKALMRAKDANQASSTLASDESLTSDTSNEQNAEWMSVDQLAALLKQSNNLAGPNIASSTMSSPEQAPRQQLGLLQESEQGWPQAMAASIMSGHLESTPSSSVAKSEQTKLKDHTESLLQGESSQFGDGSTWKPEWPKKITKRPGQSEESYLASAHVTSEEMVRRLNRLMQGARLARDAFSALSKVGQGVPPVAFIKTHRTGSSSIANLLHRLGEEHSMLFLLPGDEHSNALGWPAPFPGASVGKPAHQYDMICNNAVFNVKSMTAFLKPAPFFFTALRRPLDQIESSFEFFKPPCGQKWEDRVNWLEKLHNNPNDPALSNRAPALLGQFRNSQAHDLGWYERIGSGSHDHDDEAIAEWIDELEQSLGLVMLTEYFDEGLVLLRRKLNIEVGDLVNLRMKQGVAIKEQPTAGQAARLRTVTHVDTVLYDHFNQTFWVEWERAGGYPKLSSELHEIRSRSTALAQACSGDDTTECPWSYRTDSSEYTDFLRKKQIQILGKGGSELMTKDIKFNA